ncbi:MAG: class I SAM-dependent methyltransferase [Burkholderiaceae bacterium]
MQNKERAEMATYYAKLAGKYDQDYATAEQQADLAELHERVSEVLSGHRVLELACGTGHWTEQIAASVESVLATDINPEMLEQAKAKGLPSDKVQFRLMDAFDPNVEGDFTACFAGFWWSHVKRQEQASFLAMLRKKLGKDGLLVLLDDCHVESDSTTIARTDLEGNTFQLRTLPNGERYEVLKNYPTDSALRKRFSESVKEIRILRLENFWMLTGRFK